MIQTRVTHPRPACAEPNLILGLQLLDCHWWTWLVNYYKLFLGIFLDPDRFNMSRTSFALHFTTSLFPSVLVTLCHHRYTADTVWVFHAWVWCVTLPANTAALEVIDSFRLVLANNMVIEENRVYPPLHPTFNTYGQGLGSRCLHFWSSVVPMASSQVYPRIHLALLWCAVVWDHLNFQRWLGLLTNSLMTSELT